MTIAGYHAHLYFPTADSVEGAAVQQQVRDRFGDAVMVGRFHAVPVGPHPIAMFQIAFPPVQLEPMVAWLIEHRAGRSVLIHPRTGDDLVDHRDHALWLGPALPLNLKFLEGLKGAV
jgi:aromatic ring-cleaving dioxygenase